MAQWSAQAFIDALLLDKYKTNEASKPSFNTSSQTNPNARRPF